MRQTDKDAASRLARSVGGRVEIERRRGDVRLLWVFYERGGCARYIWGDYNGRGGSWLVAPYGRGPRQVASWSAEPVQS